VCMRCHMGTVLRAPPGFQPRSHEPLLIVDLHLRLQAVSRHAEGMLMVDEPAAVDVPLEESWCAPPFRTNSISPTMVGRAVGGSRLATRVQLRTVDDPGIEVVARVLRCGPPPAALLILTPLRTPRTRRSERAQRRAAVADGSLAA